MPELRTSLGMRRGEGASLNSIAKTVRKYKLGYEDTKPSTERIHNALHEGNGVLLCAHFVEPGNTDFHGHIMFLPAIQQHNTRTAVFVVNGPEADFGWIELKKMQTYYLKNCEHVMFGPVFIVTPQEMKSSRKRAA